MSGDWIIFILALNILEDKEELKIAHQICIKSADILHDQVFTFFPSIDSLSGDGEDTNWAFGKIRRFETCQNNS